MWKWKCYPGATPDRIVFHYMSPADPVSREDFSAVHVGFVGKALWKSGASTAVPCGARSICNVAAPLGCWTGCTLPISLPVLSACQFLHLTSRWPFQFTSLFLSQGAFATPQSLRYISRHFCIRRQSPFVFWVLSVLNWDGEGSLGVISKQSSSFPSQRHSHCPASLPIQLSAEKQGVHTYITDKCGSWGVCVHVHNLLFLWLEVLSESNMSQLSVYQLV